MATISHKHIVCLIAVFFIIDPGVTDCPSGSGSGGGDFGSGAVNMPYIRFSHFLAIGGEIGKCHQL